MPLETATYINGLDPSNPAAGDGVTQADDHLRLIKSTLKSTFPNVTAAVTITAADLNGLIARIEQLEAGNFIGKVSVNAGSTTPSRHLLCYGQAVSRATYALLFAAIGTTYGAGNGTTTFNVPDYRGLVLAGLDNMGGTSAARISAVLGATATTLGGVGGSQYLHAHTHGITDPGHVHTGTTAAGGWHAHTGSTSSSGDHIHEVPHPSGTGVGAGASNSWSGGGTSIDYTNITGAHSHNFTTDGGGDHTHTFTAGSNVTGISVNSNGAGGSQNIQPTAMVNYVIFAGA